VTLPEVVTGELAGRFGEISLFNHHADFELESVSNSNSTSPWAIADGPFTMPALRAWPPRPQPGPHEGFYSTTGRQGARKRVQLGLRRRPRSRLGLQPSLRVLLEPGLRVRLRVGPRGARVRR
jgi:hypothetical protein